MESVTVEPDKQDLAIESVAGTASDANRELQRGVQDVESVTLNWSKASLIAVFVKYVVLPPSKPSCVQDIADRSVAKHLVPLLRQCVPVLHPVQLTPLRHERLRRPLTAESHIHRCRLDVGCSLHLFGEGHGRLGSSGRLCNYGRFRYSGLDHDGYLQWPGHLLRCICKLDMAATWYSC